MSTIFLDVGCHVKPSHGSLFRVVARGQGSALVLVLPFVVLGVYVTQASRGSQDDLLPLLATVSLPHHVHLVIGLLYLALPVISILYFCVYVG